MSQLPGSDPMLFPSLSPAVLGVIRIAYGALLLATVLGTLPHARRYFLSERWGGYAQSGRLVDALQNPVVLPMVMALWCGTSLALIAGWQVVAAALVNVLLCRYFFVQMRWRGVLRGMGAPGFMTYWLGAAVLLLELTRAHMPAVQGLALLVLQVDFALIMLSAGMYKFSAGYRQNQGMELGMVNPEWGYWWRFWSRFAPRSRWFRLFNALAWSTEVVAAILMLFPPTRFIGGMLILVSFIFIATQIRLGFLCEMVIVCCLLFAHPGTVIDRWSAALVGGGPAMATAAAPMPIASGILAAALWGYLFLLPFARAGLEYNLRARRRLPSWLQPALDSYTNAFGLIIWRVFSADITNFFVNVCEQRADGTRRLLSRWGKDLRYRQVAESIAVTSLFTTLKYYPSNNALFVERVVRYARTVPAAAGASVVFEYLSVVKRPDRFEFVPAAEFAVDRAAGTIVQRTLDASLPVGAAAEGSPIHEGVRPGSYAPLPR